MTDPFADLERELLAAHARTPRRRLGALPRVAAAAVLAVAAVGVVGWLGASGDPERAASPQEKPYTPFERDSGPAPGRDPDADLNDQPGVTPVDGCAGQGYVPPRTGEPVPAKLAQRLAVLETGRPAEMDPRMPGAQAERVYGSPVALPDFGAYRVSIVAADIIPRSQVGRQRDPCAAPEGPTQPGVCLVLADDKGSMVACFTVAELDAGEAFLDVRSSIVGIAPDSALVAEAGDDESVIEGNVFSLPGGPDTQVRFRFATPGDEGAGGGQVTG
jgi:hypothetical protein